MRLLVAHDGSEQASQALNMALELHDKIGGVLDIVTVVPDLCLATEDLSLEESDLVSGSLFTEAKAQMKRVIDTLADRGLTAGVVIESGRPAERIAEVAKRLGADLIVLGSQGKHGAARVFPGSVCSRVAAIAEVSVLIVK